MKKKNTIYLISGISLILVLYVLSGFASKRFDLTSDQRFTLTKTSKNIIEKIDHKLEIKILLAGDLPSDYRLLKNETEFLLEELKDINQYIQYEFVDPLDEFTQGELDTLIQAVPIKVENKTLNIYPYLKLKYFGEEQESAKEIWTRILVDDPTTPFNELALETIDKLEYIILKDIQNLTNIDRKSVGVVVHHDELPERNLVSFLNAASEKYNIDVYLEPLKDSIPSLKNKDLEALKKFDALIVPKPTLAFSDSDKLVMDQYIMNGGKTLWMLENVDAEMDSIFRSNQIIAFPRELNLNDFFFSYGVRLIPVLIKDLDGGKIVLADGQTGNNVSYNYYNWPYFVKSAPADSHPINQSIDAVRMEFANPIELLDNPNVSQTVLLSSSPRTNFTSALSRIELNHVNIQNPEQYKAGLIPTAVLVEGNFKSAYANRYESKEFPNFKSNSVNGKMIIISDGDVIKNHIWNGRAMPLGADKYTLRFDNKNQNPIVYQNQAFIMNCLDYLLGESDFLTLRNRELSIPLLDSEKVKERKKSFQFYSILFPLLIIAILWFILHFIKKRRFS